MPSRFSHRLFSVVLCGVFVLAVLPGCDTTEPVPPADPTEVAGTYDFAEFRFVPTSTGITAPTCWTR